MTDLEKTIKGLECCTERCCAGEECPYFKDDEDCDMLKFDALDLLRQYESLKRRHVTLVAVCDELYAALKEQGEIIKNYHKADGFLAAHGWKW